MATAFAILFVMALGIPPVVLLVMLLAVALAPLRRVGILVRHAHAA